MRPEQAISVLRASARLIRTHDSHGVNCLLPHATDVLETAKKMLDFNTQP